MLNNRFKTTDNKVLINCSFTLSNFEIWNTETENYPSDCYGLLHVTRTISDDESDAHSETDLEAFRNEDNEVRNFSHHSEDEKDDLFPKSKAKVTEFKVTLQIRYGKITKTFCFIPYTMRCVT